MPRTAVNSTEMWKEDTFSPDTIDEELGWAESVGYNSLRFLEATFRWAREAGPRQPLTAGTGTDFGSPVSTRIMELSDIISLQALDDAEGVRAKLMACRRHRRPVICTEWLKRQSGSTFAEILPVFSTMGVGWYNRGLVNSKVRRAASGNDESKMWEHYVLHEDGKPYDAREMGLIGGFRFEQ